MNKEEKNVLPPVEIIPPQISSASQYIPPKQSANALFNFMRKIDYLKLILKNKAIIPRYYEEYINYLGEDIPRIAYPMTCFCDINLQKLIPHTTLYGQYGIVFYKVWGIENKIQPIHYINKNSHICEDFSLLFNRALETESNDEMFEGLKNYLLTHLLFMKPIDGKMKQLGEEKDLNFHDEREWRYVPNIYGMSTEMPLIVPPESLNPVALNSLSEGLKNVEGAWLKFQYSNIKYLIVKDLHDQKELIQYIIEELSCKIDEKYDLISKILVLDELNEDW
ncbi:abortive infection system antitoxin AbiGi family protein [Desulforamulus ruminis]|uniref:abortive infection system antitoxin AbiGi family protein n=1 Tax=Desulforamulus ruminis TaxID=1564 RepID=UPI002352F51B|nr:abortive infection system antitoxin AbiGi family protein [Desulforamulus ruminis]